MKNKELILGCALRYALGRKTYIVHVVQDEIIDEWNSLSENTQNSLVVDITEYLMDNSGISEDSWGSFGKELFSRLTEEGKEYVRIRVRHKFNPFPF